MKPIDPYMLDIAEKDESSTLLAELALPTLNHSFVRQAVSGKNGLSFLQIPEGFVLVGHTSGGNHSITEPKAYSASVFNYLVKDSQRIGATPVAFADVIDARSTEESFVRQVGTTFRDSALKYNVAILNGELAKLGPMVNCPCNISGTMLSTMRRDSPFLEKGTGIFVRNGVKYFVFDPQGKLIWMNSDGVGTKSLIHARLGTYTLGVEDLFAMQFDDKGKFGGGAIATFNLVETNGDVPFDRINQQALGIATSMGAVAIMQHTRVGNRLIGPDGERNVFNMSGTLVSLVDEDMIRNRPRPNEGDTLIAIRGNGRSNGFTDKRRLMVEWHGANWEQTPEGKYMGEFLSKPSKLFYPLFAELIQNRLASSVYHMSGGAYRDKLAKPLSKEGLYVEIGIKQGSSRLHQPDPRECMFAAQFNTPDAYSKYPMGNEGFVATSNLDKALPIIESHGFEAKPVARLERRADGRTGALIRAYNGDVVDFSRKAA